MSKQTAVQILVESMTSSDRSFYQKEIAIALQMEREQIIDAFGIGCQVESTRLVGYHDMANQHYNETYGGQDE